MDKDKLLNEVKKLLRDKKVSSLLAILLILAFVLIAFTVFSPGIFNGTNSNKGTLSENENTKKVSSDENNTDYEKQEKEKLVSILKKIDGVGDVDVNIHFGTGEVKVPAYDSTSQTTTTEENDTSGGKRVNNTKNDGETVVMSTENGNNSPVILETHKPKVIGVVVVAEGAKNSKTKSDIEKAVTSLYDLGANKVNVYPMK